MAILAGELAAKPLEVLHQIVPNSKNVAVLINADFGPSARFRAEVEAAARALGLVTPFLEASKPSEIEAAFNSLAQTRPDALLVGPGPFLDSHRDLLVQRAAKIAMPAAYETRGTPACERARIAIGGRQQVRRCGLRIVPATAASSSPQCALVHQKIAGAMLHQKVRHLIRPSSIGCRA